MITAIHLSTIIRDHMPPVFRGSPGRRAVSLNRQDSNGTSEEYRSGIDTFGAPPLMMSLAGFEVNRTGMSRKSVPQ
ncbi:hypothetical protein [Ensifer canadensis]